MGVKLEGLVGRTDLIKLNVECIVANHEEHNYCRFEDLDNEYDRNSDLELAKSIEETGQIQPVRVIREGEKAKLVAGFRRYRVIKDIINPARVSRGEEPLPILAMYSSEKDGFMLNLTENIQRKHLTPMDIATCISALDTRGYKDAQIAEIFGNENGKKRTVGWVSQHRSLLNLTKEIQKQVHSGEISFSSAIQLALIEPEKQELVISVANEKAVEKAAEKAATTVTVEPVVKTPDSEVETNSVEPSDSDTSTVEVQEEKKKRGRPAKEKVETEPVEPKAKLKDVQEAIREVTGKRVARSLKDVKEFLTTYSTGNPLVHVNSLLDFISGKISEEELAEGLQEKEEV